jgi:hypothetical protein
VSWREVKPWPANRFERLARYGVREHSRFADFLACTSRLTPWSIAKALNTLSPGVDYRGMSKLALADEYVRGEHLRAISGQRLREACRGS